jgi:hypothetical protein
MNPAADLLKALVSELNAVGRARMQHLKPEYLAAEQRRLAAAQDAMDTSAQLARYGVTLE